MTRLRRLWSMSLLSAAMILILTVDAWAATGTVTKQLTTSCQSTVQHVVTYKTFGTYDATAYIAVTCSSAASLQCEVDLFVNGNFKDFDGGTGNGQCTAQTNTFSVSTGAMVSASGRVWIGDTYYDAGTTDPCVAMGS